MPSTPHPRPYEPGDETSWLRCRVLAFLDTTYFDDVATSKPDLDAAVQLVVEMDGQIVGILDATLDGDAATLECIATHPDYRRRGIAEALLDRAMSELSAQGARSIDAWTREDPAALGWYRSLSFEETTRYLHVYANEYQDFLPGALIDAVRHTAGVRPVQIFAHAPIEREMEMRRKYRRVYICRRLERDITAAQANRFRPVFQDLAAEAVQRPA